MVQAQVHDPLPPASDVCYPDRLEGVFEGGPQPSEVRILPNRGVAQDAGELLDEGARTAVPGEPVEGPDRHDIGAVHESARVLEVALQAEQLEVIAVRTAGAVGEGDVPQLAGASTYGVPRPGARDLYRREPDVAPDHARVHPQHAVVGVAIDAVRVGEAQRRGRSQVPPQAQHVVHGVRTRGRLILIVDGTEIRDPGSSNLA